MANNTYDIDPRLLAEFIDESVDALGELDAMLVELETQPFDLDIINAIFRPIHSIKGNSSFFGLLKVTTLSHELETLLDLVRKQRLTVTKNLIDVLLEGINQLRTMMQRARNGEPEVEDEEHFEKLLDKVVCSQKSEADENTILRLALLEGLNVLRDAMGSDGSQEAREFDRLIGLVTHLDPKSIFNDAPLPPRAEAPIPGPLRKLKELLKEPFEGQLEDEKSREVLKELDNLKVTIPGGPALDHVDCAIEEYHIMVAALGFDPLLRDILLEKIEAITPLISVDTPPKPQAPAPGVPEKTKTAQPLPETTPGSKPHHETAKTMRVSEESIDSFLNFVGELVITNEMFNHLQDRILSADINRDLAGEFKIATDTFSSLSHDLQKSIMEIRLVPVKTILTKVPKIVRDIASKSNKEISVEIEGENIRVDKSLIDTLEAPLIHMLRNAADHGVEPPDKRQACGKDRQGKIHISVTETHDNITLAISDDGKGLDFAAIKNKAVSMELISEGQELTEDDVISLIFSSGVSTAEEITDVSGRGVGMDVVKRNVDDAGGKISVESSPGKGSRFSIDFPKSVSTQIMDGFIVKVSDTNYVLPIEKIRQLFNVDPQQITTIGGNKADVVVQQEKLLPIIHLRETFDCTNADWRESNQIVMVSVTSQKKEVALHIDDIVGIQRVILKQDENITLSSGLFTGTALMGNGKVALVLDIDKVCGSCAAAS
jgi:two-component system, chemotaxis family, sensor kinase CheA